MVSGKYTIDEISQVLNGKLIGNSEDKIQDILIDSRNILPTRETSLFFAIRGERHNGHDFINELYKKGIRNFIVDYAFDYQKYNANFVLVENVLSSLQKLAAFHRKTFEIPVVGITGSNGKTIVKEWLFQLLHRNKNIVRSPKSYNSQVGVPLSVWQLDKNQGCNLAVFEAGISQVGEMEVLQKIINPTIGIFTNLGDAHQENFKSQKQKLLEKIKLFSSCEMTIFCKDNPIVNELFSEKILFENLFSWTKNKDTKADLIIQKISKNKPTEIEAIYKNKNIKIHIPFFDNASIENCINLWCLLLYFGYNEGFINERMMQLLPVAMRLEQINGKNNCTIINDSYNSDLGSLYIALDFLNLQKQHKKKTLILSDILQTEENIEKLYKEISQLLINSNISNFIGIGKNIKKCSEFFPENSLFYENTNEFINNISVNSFSNETILLKGARSFHFEKISSLLQEKQHRTVLEINLNAIVHNLNYFRSLLSPKVKQLVMVKAFSYGSGSYEIANLLQHERVDYLGVAYIDEGIELRKAGITLPILVMNPEIQDFASLIEYNLEPEIYSIRALKELYRVVKIAGINSMPIHIKLDTGMKRLGFTTQEIPQLIKELKFCDNLKVKSIFSHLAGADNPEHDNFTQNQIKTFENNSNKIITSLNYSILRHILNSAGIERFPNAQFDMVRLGIGLYGISCKNQKNLRNISTLKTHISQIKEVENVETIGYNRKGTVQKKSKIAIIAIGYADGFRRKLSNGKGYVFINSQKAFVVGNICMDMCMIDITNIDAKEGDEVIIFGEELPISELANILETIPYEIMTSISHRVKKIYFKE